MRCGEDLSRGCSSLLCCGGGGARPTCDLGWLGDARHLGRRGRGDELNSTSM